MVLILPSLIFCFLPLLVPLISASPASSSLRLNNTTAATTAVSNARDTFCFRNAAWTKPHWDANVEEPCRLIINHLLAQYVVPDQFAEFEFLPLGQAQVTAWGAVRTPFKLVMGACTLAITNTHAFAPRGMPELPALGHGPFRPWVASTWYKLLNRAEEIQNQCIEAERSWVKWRSGPYAGVSWFIPQPDLLLFMYATGSEMDRRVGARVNALLEMGAGNATSGIRGYTHS